jgi:hypothetical protein
MNEGLLLGLDHWAVFFIVGAIASGLAVAVFLYFDMRTRQHKVLAQVERIQHKGQAKP